MTHTRSLASRTSVALLALSVAGLAACTSAGSASTAPSVPVASEPSATAAPTPEPSASEAPPAAVSEPSDASAEPRAVATSIDPCQVITSSEIATLTGSRFGPPSSATTENNGRLCSYGQEGLFVNVIVVQAADAATAKQEEPAFKAQLEKTAADAGIANMKLTEMADFEPGVDAAILHGSYTANGTKYSGVAFYALKGAVLLALTELAYGGGIPTDAAIEAVAKAALGRIP